MSDEERNGAPYDLTVSFPDQKKDSLVYTFQEADELISTVGTLFLVHIKENIRQSTGRRTVFEVTATPDPDTAKPVAVVEEEPDDRVSE